MLGTRLTRVIPSAFLLAPVAITLAAALHTVVPAAGAGTDIRRDVVLVDHHFFCEDYKQPLDLDLLRVTFSAAMEEGGHTAVNLGNRGGRPCAGRIGRLEVDTQIGDAVKVGQGAHDLVIESGRIHAHGKRSEFVHQDGIQFMGGKRITIRNIEIWNETGHAGWFNGPDLGLDSYPTDVVLENCVLRGSDGSLWTWWIKKSVRSGLRNCILVAGNANKPERALLIESPDLAIDPVDQGNRIIPAGVSSPDIPEWMRAAGSPVPPSSPRPPASPPSPPSPSEPKPAPGLGKPKTEARSIRFRPLIVQGPPRSGRFFVVKAAVIDQGGKRVNSGLVKCNAKIGHFPIPVIHNPFRNGAALCTWRVPRRMKKRTLGGIITVVHNGVKAQVKFTRRIVS
jgi:hypothetical protein